MALYRIFVQDVDEHGFSAYGNADIEAQSPRGARRAAVRRWGDPGPQLIALPHYRRDLWPNGHTGLVPDEALEMQ